MFEFSWQSNLQEALLRDPAYFGTCESIEGDCIDRSPNDSDDRRMPTNDERRPMSGHMHQKCSCHLPSTGAWSPCAKRFGASPPCAALQALLVAGDADDARGLADREGHLLRRHGLRRPAKVALVLAVLARRCLTREAVP